MRKLLNAPKRLPKESIGALPFFLVSLELGASLVAGYLAARFFAGKETGARGRLPELQFVVGSWKVHLHHWLVFSGILAFGVLLNIFVVAPALFYGFLGGVVAQGIWQYEDWRQVIGRQR